MGWFNEFLDDAVGAVGDTISASGHMKTEQVDRLDANTKIALMSAESKIKRAERQDNLMKNISTGIMVLVAVWIIVNNLKRKK